MRISDWSSDVCSSDLGAFDGIEQGRMQLDQVVRLLKEIGAAVDMVGLAIAEHLPWDMLRLRHSLSELPIMKSLISLWAETAPLFRIPIAPHSRISHRRS